MRQYLGATIENSEANESGKYLAAHIVIDFDVTGTRNVILLRSYQILVDDRRTWYLQMVHHTSRRLPILRFTLYTTGVVVMGCRPYSRRLGLGLKLYSYHPICLRAAVH